LVAVASCFLFLYEAGNTEFDEVPPLPTHLTASKPPERIGKVGDRGEVVL
jgi:hypothetical protein